MNSTLEARIDALESTINKMKFAQASSFESLSQRIDLIATILAEQKKTSVLLASDSEQAVADMRLLVSKSVQEAFAKLHSTERQLSNLFKVRDSDMKLLIHDKFGELESRVLDKVNNIKSLGSRIVQWSIPQRCSTISSPRFNIAGISSVRLELVYAKPPEPNLPDCGLSLWAPPDCFLIYTLRAGNLSRKFQHRFPSTLGESPYGALAFRTDDAVVGDSFSVSVEIHEAESAVTENSITSSFNVSFFNFPDFFASKDCRKVEWRINPADLEISSGARIASSLFNLSGIHSLQLVFFPTGHLQPDTSICSCYISAPVGTALSGWLSVGSVRRRVDFDATDSIKETSERVGYGRGSFCELARAGELVIRFDLSWAEQETFEGRIIRIGKMENFHGQTLILNKVDQRSSRKWPIQIN